jgi:hypothetical protein
MDKCEHRNTFFSRSLCYCEPDGVMHTYCLDCHKALDFGCGEIDAQKEPTDGQVPR